MAAPLYLVITIRIKRNQVLTATLWLEHFTGPIIRSLSFHTLPLVYQPECADTELKKDSLVPGRSKRAIEKVSVWCRTVSISNLVVLICVTSAYLKMTTDNAGLSNTAMNLNGQHLLAAFTQFINPIIRTYVPSLGTTYCYEKLKPRSNCLFDRCTPLQGSREWRRGTKAGWSLNRIHCHYGTKLASEGRNPHAKERYRSWTLEIQMDSSIRISFADEILVADRPTVNSVQPATRIRTL